MWKYNQTNELYHHGIKGQKWGIRRYQNEDGTYTSEGRQRYIDSKTKGARRDLDSYTRSMVRNGIRDKKGRLVLSSDEVKRLKQEQRLRLRKQEQKYGKKYDRIADKANFKNYMKSDPERAATRTRTNIKKGAAIAGGLLGGAMYSVYGTSLVRDIMETGTVSVYDVLGVYGGLSLIEASARAGTEVLKSTEQQFKDYKKSKKINNIGVK